MKILFLESKDWQGATFRAAIAALKLPWVMDFQIARATALQGLNREDYEVIFIPLKEAQNYFAEGFPGSAPPQPYWVALAKTRELDLLPAWMQNGGSDYFTNDADTFSDCHLSLTLWRILNTAQREMRLRHLEAENQLFKAVINQVPSKIFIKNWEGQYLLANQEMAEFYGTTPEAMVGKRDTDFHLDESTTETFLRQNQEVIETGRVITIAEEYEMDARGDERWLYWHKSPVALAPQAQVAVLGIGTDVTHYHNLLAALGSANQRLSLALHAANAGVWNWDLVTNHMTWSDENFRLMGYHPYACEPSYANWLAAIHPDDQEAVDSAVLQVFADLTDLDLEVRVQWPDGSLHWIQCVGQFTRDHQDNATGLLGIQIDITKRKQTEAEIAFQASLLKQVRNAVIATDLNGKIIYWNRFAEVMYQWSAPEAIGANVMEILVPHGESLQADLILQTVIEQGYWEGEFEVYRKDGSLLPIHVADSLLHDDQGNPIGYVGVSSDISDRKHLEAEQAWQAKLLEGQREILELMALGTPLPEVLDQIIQIMEAQTGGMVGSILLLKGQQLWHGAAPSLPEAYQQAINGIAIGPRVGSCGTAAYLKEPVAVTDIANDPLWQDYREVALAHGLRACWSVPIFSRTGEVLGTFAQYFRQPYLPDIQDWAKINMAVKLAGLAIEQNQSDAALKASEVRFRSLFEQAAVGIGLFTLEGQFLRTNQRLCEILGYSPQELLARTFQDVTHPDDLVFNLEALQHLLRGELSTYTLEKRYIRKDRTVVWGNVTVSLMRDETGTPLGLIGVVEDVTARKQAVTALQELVEGAAAVTGQDFFPALAAYLATSLKVRYVLITKKLEENYQTYAFWADGQIQPNITGSLAQAPCGLALADGLFACPQQLQQRFPENSMLQDLGAEAYIGVRLTNMAGDGIGSLCVIDDKPIPNLQQAVNILRVFAARVSAEIGRQAAIDALQQLNQTLESRVAERTAALAQSNLQLQQSLAERQMLAALVENSTDFIATATLTGEMTYLNRGGRQLVGLSETADISAYVISDFHFSEDWSDLEGTVLPPLLQGGTWQGEVRLRHFQTGAAIPMVHSAFAIHDPQTGEPVAFAGILRDITDLKQKEAQLHRLSERLTLALQSGKFGIWEYDNLRDRLIWDDRMCELYGISPRDFKGTVEEWAQRVHPDDLAEAEAVAAQAVRGERPYDTEFRVVHPSGEVRFIKAYAIHERQDNGEFMRAVGVNFDITDLKQAEAALRESEARMRIMIEALPDLLLRVTPDGTCRDVIFSRYASETFFPIDHHLSEVLPEPLFRQQLGAIQQAIATGEIQVYEHLLEHQGRLIYEEVRVGAISEEEALVIVRNISDRKQTETALQESEARYRLLMEGASDAIIMASTEGKLLDINQKATSLLGYSREELLQMTIDQIHPPETLEQARNNFARLLRHSSHPPIKNFVRRKDGCRVPIEVTATLIEINGQWVAQGIFRDISERQRVEREMLMLRERLQFLLAASPAIIYTCKPDGTFACTFISENVERVLGFTPAEWQAEPEFWVNRLHPEDGPGILAGLAPLFEVGSHSHEYRFLHKAGHYVWIRDELRLIYDEQGEPLEIVGYMADVTKLKQVELALQQLNENLESMVSQRTQELREQTHLLETILNSMGDGVLVANPRGEIILYNPAGATMTSIDAPVSADPAVWQSHWGIYLPDNTPCPRDQIPLWRAIQGESFDRMEVLVRNSKFPQGVYLEVTGRPLKNSGEQTVGGVTVFRDISNRKHSEAQLRHNSLHDGLTDLPNRDFLTQQLELAIQQAQLPEQKGFAVLFLDLDHFKVINDSLGHAAGDQVLVQIAQWLSSLVGSTDMAARLGGDEFVLLLNSITDLKSPLRLADRLLQEFKLPRVVGEREIFVSTSIGIVVSNAVYQTASDVLRDADIALYQAKARGRNQYALFNEEMHVQALERLQLEHDLRNALAQGELLLYYQPVIDLAHQRVAGFEALVRWQHPTQGFVSPAKFIPLAEETGLIALLDRWVLRTACQQLVTWRSQFPHYRDLTISTNLVVTDLMYPDILNTIDQILEETGLDGQHLNLEITESMLIEQIQSMALVLEQLQSRGIRVSIDDFGTGYSSLSYLHQLPVNAFKIDRSFVMQMESNRKNAEIVKTIITLSNRLGMKIIAEGIETETQLKYLKGLNCDMGQGYLFSPPLSTEAATDFLTNFAAPS